MKCFGCRTDLIHSAFTNYGVYLAQCSGAYYELYETEVRNITYYSVGYGKINTPNQGQIIGNKNRGTTCLFNFATRQCKINAYLPLLLDDGGLINIPLMLNRFNKMKAFD